MGGSLPGGRGTGLLQGARFGEIAQRLGFINQEHCDEGIERQARFRWPGDDPLVCGWTMAAGSEDEGIEHGPTEGHPCLATGIAQGAQDRWLEVFRRAGLRWEAIYSLNTTAAAGLSDQDCVGEAVVIESQSGVITATGLRGGRVEWVHTQPRNGRPVDPEVLGGLIGGESFDALWLGAEGDGLDAAAGELAGESGVKSERLPLPARVDIKLGGEKEFSHLQMSSMAGMVGAACAALGFAGRSRAVAVPACEPAPALWRRSGFRVAAVLGTVLIVMAGLDAGVTQRLGSVRDRHLAALEHVSELELLREDLEDKIGRGRRLQTSITELERELGDMRMRCGLLEDVLPARRQFVLGFLDAVTAATSEDIVLDSVVETQENTIEIAAWSLTQKGAYAFAHALTVAGSRWGLSVAEERIQARRGRLELPGFTVRVQLHVADGGATGSDVVVATTSTAKVSSAGKGQR